MTFFCSPPASSVSPDSPKRRFSHLLCLFIKIKKHENIPLLLEEIVYLQAENKIVHATDRNGYRYMLDKPLSIMETELNPLSFFRANRQYIININYIKRFRTVEKVKVQVTMDLMIGEHSVVISQESAAAFRKWIQYADRYFLQLL
ncbi:LytR/AlgR family response regulator transcription factor [Pseudobacter ginsenosidimutans]|uniref:LytR/AlgR family response regulator transcription factor n=1 Tax=Pseudobacter ginsenosidimutans TaxID=661488 RepID=UPI0013154531|nr:LytTR family DNA-binding domain-containing protein [Pseudobacter ginsenosidimutans]